MNSGLTKEVDGVYAKSGLACNDTYYFFSQNLKPTHIVSTPLILELIIFTKLEENQGITQKSPNYEAGDEDSSYKSLGVFVGTGIS